MVVGEVGGGAVGAGVDVWRFGVVAYELLVGAPPFTGTAEQIVLAMDTEEPRLRARNAPVSQELERLVQVCLERDPTHRYASAIPLLEDLRRIRAGEPLRARRRVWGGRLVGAARRHPAALPLTPAAGAALA